MIGTTDDSEAPLIQIVSLKPGAARIAGRVVAGAAGFTAPLSNRPCVYYQIHGRNHRRPWHDHFHHPPQGARIEVEDESGRIWLNVPAPPGGGPTRADPGVGSFCEIAGQPFRRTIYVGESRELDQLLSVGEADATPDDYLHAEEWIISVGDHITVLGEVIQEITPDGTSPNYRTPPMRLVFWVKSLRA